jgi:hypothetical protein
MNSFLENRPLVARKGAMASASKAAEPGFQPLFAPNVIEKSRVQQPPVSETQAADGPSVELVQNGGKVERIIVTCTCCNRIELQCQY